MSAISDGVTVIGDGSNSTTLALAAASVANVATMQSYSGPATVMQVADAYQGGTFNYVQAEAFISGSLVFNGATITLPSAQTTSFFSAGKTIRISGTSSPNYDGTYVSTAFDGTTVTVSPSFLTESHMATISVVPFQNDFLFSYASGTVTIFNSNYAAFAPASFLANGFYVGQSIAVTGTSGYNSSFTVASVTDDTITASVGSSFPVSEFAYATLNDSTAYTASLVFNSGGTAPTVISDSTTGLFNAGFHVNQSIQVTGSTLNNGVFKVSAISKPTGSTSQLVIPSAFPTASTQTAIITTTDAGLTFPATGKGAGMWRRQYDPKGGISVTWFGAKPAIGSGSDAINTAAIQAAINSAAKSAQDIAQVYIPHGTYRIKQLVLPRGIYLKGEGSKQANGGTRLVQIYDDAKPNTSMILFSSFTSGNALRYWDGKICDIAFQGAIKDNDTTLYSSGFGICFRTVEGYRVALDDLAILDNIIVRGFASGGIEMPLGAAPAFISNVKFELNGGPGVSVTKPSTTAAQVQSTSFINISGDGNIGGLISLSGYDSTSCFVFINLKGENSDSNPYSPTVTQQQNMIVLDNSFTAMLSIHGACNQTVVPATGTRAAIGDLILRKDGTNSNPILFWNGVNFRYNTSQTGTAPKVLSGSNIGYTQNAGYTGGSFTSDSILPSANNTYSLGSSSFKYANVYASNLLQLGTSGSYSPSGTIDLNTVTNSVTTFANSSSTNTPVAGAGNLLSLGQSSSFSNQLFLKNGVNAMYIRANTSGTWSPWAKVITANTIETATDSAYTVSAAGQMVKLPVVTAARTLTLPAASGNTGISLTIWNKNTAAFSWSFASGVVVDAAGASVTTLSNSTIYSLMSDGTNWVKVN